MGIVNDQMLGTHYDYLMLLTKLHSGVASTEKQCIKDQTASASLLTINSMLAEVLYKLSYKISTEPLTGSQ